MTVLQNNIGRSLWICATPQQADLNQAAFAALTYVQVKGVGSGGEIGTKENQLTYPTWDSTVVQKSKGMADAGNPPFELARDPLDAGQIILRAAAATEFNYAYKIMANDTPSGGSSPTIIYNRGLVMRPTRPQGKNEDFDLEVFTFANNQLEIVVDPT